MTTQTQPETSHTAISLLAAAEWALLDRLWDHGQDLFDNATREDQLDWLLGLEHIAKMNMVPNGCWELYEYFEPAFQALNTPKISPFTGQPVAQRPVPQAPTGTTGSHTENAPVNGGYSGPSTPAVPVTIPEGYFTIRHPDSDQYETVRIWRPGKQSNWYGQILVGHINGPNNQSDYQAFGTIDETTGQVKLWGRFRDIDPRWPEAIRTVIGMDREGRIEAGKAYAQVSKRCMVCGLPLTTPKSLDDGIGPVCANGGW